MLDGYSYSFLILLFTSEFPIGIFPSKDFIANCNMIRGISLIECILGGGPHYFYLGLGPHILSEIGLGSHILSDIGVTLFF